MVALTATSPIEAATKVAVVDALAPASVIEQVELPEQALVPPLHPVKKLPEEAVAVSTTVAPFENVPVQVPPEEVQEEIPAGLDETEPEPDPETVTAMV